MGGAEFLYIRHESGMETLTARGPLTEPVIIEVCVTVLRLIVFAFLKHCALLSVVS